MHQLLQVIKQSLASLKYSFSRFNYEPVWLLNSAYNPGQTTNSPFSINELMDDGMLWGVPKKRPSVERRVKKRFGTERYPQYTAIVKPRSDIVTCERCGDHHETYTICRTCYSEVKKLTLKMMEAIKGQTDPLQPKEKELSPKFQGEESSQEERDNYHIIEIDQPRPNWFTKNLLAKSSRPSSGLRDVIINPDDTIEKK